MIVNRIHGAKKVLVTGASGFVGRHVVDELLRRGWEVGALARNPERTMQAGARGVTLVRGDVRQAETLDFAGFDAVIHLVGIIRETGGQTFERVHFQGTVNAVDAAKKAGARRFVQMSALGARPDAASMYHKTKYRAEQYVIASGLPYVIFRPSVIFGEGGEFTKMLAGFYGNPFFVPVIGSGTARLQPVSVKDVARLFADALTEEKVAKRVFELGGPKAYTFMELLDEVGRLLGKRRVKLRIPAAAAFIAAAAFERILPKPPLTRDQLIMLREDNVCDTAQAAAAFGIEKWEGFSIPKQ